MSRQSQLSYELIQLLGDPQNMEAILNTARDYLHNPIHLTDLTGKLLACSVETALWIPSGTALKKRLY